MGVVEEEEGDSRARGHLAWCVEEEEGDSRARGHLAWWGARARLAARRTLRAHCQFCRAHGQVLGDHG